jgi:hypothetical protein
VVKAYALGDTRVEIVYSDISAESLTERANLITVVLYLELIDISDKRIRRFVLWVINRIEIDNSGSKC